MDTRKLLMVAILIALIAILSFYPTGSWKAEYCKDGICIPKIGYSTIFRINCPDDIWILRGTRFIPARGGVAKDYDHYFLKPDTCVLDLY